MRELESGNPPGKYGHGIPQLEIEKLLSAPYKRGKKSGVFPRPMGFKNVGFVRGVIQAIRDDLKQDLLSVRKDGQKTINHAFRLIICNLVACVFERRTLALAGANSAYNAGTPLNKMFLTKRAVDKVTSALIRHGYLSLRRGNQLLGTTNTYKPTRKLEEALVPLIYEVFEEYTEHTELIIFKGKEDKDSKNNKKRDKQLINKDLKTFGAEGKHIKGRRSLDLSLPPDHYDLVALRRINEALKDCSYALQSPVVRIFSDEDPMRGGRLYTRLQTLPDKRARIRINTLFNGEQVAEVDLSANHPRMLMALKGKELPADFYQEVAASTGTTRDQVKFLLMKAIGARNRAISLKPEVDQKDWFKEDFIVLPEQRQAIDSYLEQSHPDLFASLYRGMGVFLQGLEGDILLKTMIRLLDQGIPSLPIHDAVYVQAKFANQAQRAICEAWSDCLGVDFKPITKIDLPTNGA